MRSLARQCAQLWLKTRESLGHPLGCVSDIIGTVSENIAVVSPQELVQASIKKMNDDSRMFIFEIGTEELPPEDVVSGSKQLKYLLLQLLDKQRLNHGEVHAFATPRRLVISVENLCTRQAEKEVEVRGPPQSKAFDHEGNPTKALDGFCRRYSVPLKSVYSKVDGKTEYVYAQIREPARHSLEVLSEDLPTAVAKISFSKSMRWNSQVVFSRPIRWMLALHGDVVVPFTYAGLMSGSLTNGLRNSAFAIVKVESAESYAEVMKNSGITIDIERRKEIIFEHSHVLAESVNGHLLIPDGLLDQVVNLVEAPNPVIGKFREIFLELPKDLLTTVMQKHQKYFAVVDNDGGLLPYFIAIANGSIDEATVRKGNEAVLRSRFEDAKFFYEMDSRKRFSEFRGQLRNILFHEKLGTMLDKVGRLENMVIKLCALLGIDKSLHQTVKDAASLALSDLATAVVAELTSLSGIMGRHYALRDGYSEEISDALFEITLPRFSGDMLPKTDTGIVLAIADRLDSLVGLFSAGCQPSSANDPFGLRRISYGLVQLLVEKNKNLDFKLALELAADFQPVIVDTNTLNDVQEFVTRRLEQYLVDRGISAEVVRSILMERANFPYLAAKSAYKMEALSRDTLFQKVVEAYSRPTRIVRGKDFDLDIEVDENVFENDEERSLWRTYLFVKENINPGLEIDDFIEISSNLIQPLEDFFNNVFVMVEDEKIRTNRLALLKNIADLPTGIADLTHLPGF